MGKKKNKIIENEWIDFRKSVYETKSKSEDDFEKYINVIASGGLAITIAFFEITNKLKVPSVFSFTNCSNILIENILIANA